MLSLVLALAASAAWIAPSASSSQDAGIDAGPPPEGPRPCRIDGRASFAGLRVVRASRHGRARVSVMDLPARTVSIEAVTPTLFRVQTREGEPVVTGETRTLPPLSLRRDLSLPGLVALRGTPVVRLTPREASLDVDLDLGDGVIARRVILGCDVLRVRMAEDAAEASGAPPASPRWRSRGPTITLRDRAEEGIEALRVTVPADFVLHEVGRTEAWVHLRVPLRRGRVDGWVRDHAVVPSP